jgi:hypothetical protein
MKTFPTHGTVWLMSDVGRGSSAATRTGHDVTCPDINLELPDAKIGCTAWLGSCDVAPDRRSTEKQAPAGKLAGVGALGTHKAGQSAPESWSGRAGPRYTDSTGHDYHCNQQERGDRPSHCISCHRLGKIRLALTDPELKRFVLVHPCALSGKPGDGQKKLKHCCGTDT